MALVYLYKLNDTNWKFWKIQFENLLETCDLEECLWKIDRKTKVAQEEAFCYLNITLNNKDRNYIKDCKTIKEAIDKLQALKDKPENRYTVEDLINLEWWKERVVLFVKQLVKNIFNPDRDEMIKVLVEFKRLYNGNRRPKYGRRVIQNIECFTQICHYCGSNFHYADCPNRNSYTPFNQFISGQSARHIVNEIYVFEDYRPFGQESSMKLSDVGIALGSGTVIVESYVRGVKLVLVLRDVLYIPSSPNNIFSLNYTEKMNGMKLNRIEDREFEYILACNVDAKRVMVTGKKNKFLDENYVMNMFYFVRNRNEGSSAESMSIFEDFVPFVYLLILFCGEIVFKKMIS